MATNCSRVNPITVQCKVSIWSLLSIRGVRTLIFLSPVPILFGKFWIRIQSGCVTNYHSSNPTPVWVWVKLCQPNKLTFFSVNTKSKSNPDPVTGKKTSLLILLEAAGARIQKIQNPVHAHLCYLFENGNSPLSPRISSVAGLAFLRPNLQYLDFLNSFVFCFFLKKARRNLLFLAFFGQVDFLCRFGRLFGHW